MSVLENALKADNDLQRKKYWQQQKMFKSKVFSLHDHSPRVPFV